LIFGNQGATNLKIVLHKLPFKTTIYVLMIQVGLS
jgi:hypothetical protein